VRAASMEILKERRLTPRWPAARTLNQAQQRRQHTPSPIINQPIAPPTVRHGICSDQYPRPSTAAATAATVAPPEPFTADVGAKTHRARLSLPMRAELKAGGGGVSGGGGEGGGGEGKGEGGEGSGGSDGGSEGGGGDGKRLVTRSSAASNGVKSSSEKGAALSSARQSL
jgi:hypothetical protein